MKKKPGVDIFKLDELYWQTDRQTNKQTDGRTNQQRTFRLQGECAKNGWKRVCPFLEHSDIVYVGRH
jgi:hypothetical protein